MARITQQTRCELSRRELLTLTDIAGHRIACQSGELWITQDGEGDVLLRAGESWSVRGGDSVVVSALVPAVFSVERPAPIETTTPIFRLGRAFPALALFPSPLLR